GDLKGPEATSGKTVDAEDLRGKIVIVDFWSFAFPDYLTDLNTYQKLTEKLAGKPFTMIGVNLDKKEQSELVKQFLAQQKVPWSAASSPWCGPFCRSRWRRERANTIVPRSAPPRS